MSARFLPPCPPSLVRPRRAAFSAFRAGSLRSLLLRPSQHSPSGIALVAGFATCAAAERFAALWSRRLGLSAPIYCEAGEWEVSLPAFLGSYRWPPVLVLRQPARGGWRPFRRAVLSAGWF